ncbi:hypothetical protein ACXWTF_12975 [Thiomicrolovo sp. ZZH C-3]
MFSTLMLAAGALILVSYLIYALNRIAGGIVFAIGVGFMLWVANTPNIAGVEDATFVQVYTAHSSVTMKVTCPDLYAEIPNPGSLEQVEGAEIGVLQDADGNRYSCVACKRLARDAILAQPSRF